MSTTNVRINSTNYSGATNITEMADRLLSGLTTNSSQLTKSELINSVLMFKFGEIPIRQYCPTNESYQVAIMNEFPDSITNIIGSGNCWTYPTGITINNKMIIPYSWIIPYRKLTPYFVYKQINTGEWYYSAYTVWSCYDSLVIQRDDAPQRVSGYFRVNYSYYLGSTQRTGSTYMFGTGSNYYSGITTGRTYYAGDIGGDIQLTINETEFGECSSSTYFKTFWTQYNRPVILTYPYINYGVKFVPSAVTIYATDWADLTSSKSANRRAGNTSVQAVGDHSMRYNYSYGWPESGNSIGSGTLLPFNKTFTASTWWSGTNRTWSPVVYVYDNETEEGYNETFHITQEKFTPMLWIKWETSTATTLSSGITTINYYVSANTTFVGYSGSSSSSMAKCTGNLGNFPSVNTYGKPYTSTFGMFTIPANPSTSSRNIVLKFMTYHGSGCTESSSTIVTYTQMGKAEPVAFNTFEEDYQISTSPEMAASNFNILYGFAGQGAEEEEAQHNIYWNVGTEDIYTDTTRIGVSMTDVRANPAWVRVYGNLVDYKQYTFDFEYSEGDGCYYMSTYTVTGISGSFELTPQNLKLGVVTYDASYTIWKCNLYVRVVEINDDYVYFRSKTDGLMPDAVGRFNIPYTGISGRMAFVSASTPSSWSFMKQSSVFGNLVGATAYTGTNSYLRLTVPSNSATSRTASLTLSCGDAVSAYSIYQAAYVPYLSESCLLSTIASAGSLTLSFTSNTTFKVYSGTSSSSRGAAYSSTYGTHAQMSNSTYSVTIPIPPNPNTTSRTIYINAATNNGGSVTEASSYLSFTQQPKASGGSSKGYIGVDLYSSYVQNVSGYIPDGTPYWREINGGSPYPHSFVSYGNCDYFTHDRETDCFIVFTISGFSSFNLSANNYGEVGYDYLVISIAELTNTTQAIEEAIRDASWETYYAEGQYDYVQWNGDDFQDGEYHTVTFDNLLTGSTYTIAASFRRDDSTTGQRDFGEILVPYTSSQADFVITSGGSPTPSKILQNISVSIYDSGTSYFWVDDADSIPSSSALIRTYVNKISSSYLSFGGMHYSNIVGRGSKNAVARVDFTLNTGNSFTVYCAYSGETGYDYTIVTKLDVASPSTASTNTYWTSVGKLDARTNFSAVTFSNVSIGTHYFYIVYRKDSSVDKLPDCGMFYFPYTSTDCEYFDSEFLFLS